LGDVSDLEAFPTTQSVALYGLRYSAAGLVLEKWMLPILWYTAYDMDDNFYMATHVFLSNGYVAYFKKYLERNTYDLVAVDPTGVDSVLPNIEIVGEQSILIESDIGCVMYQNGNSVVEYNVVDKRIVWTLQIPCGSMLFATTTKNRY
jgi:hypothetical protein